MKALLVEEKSLYSLNKRTVIVLLPSGELEPGVGDPANIAIAFYEDNLRVWTPLAWELKQFKVVKEVEVNGQLLLKAVEYRNARIAYEQEKIEFKHCLINEMVDPHCDAFSFLELGSVAL